MNQYPRGKLTADDEGEISIAISELDNTVIIDFGKKVAWIGMSRPEAIEFAMKIMKRAGVKKIEVTT